MPIRHTIIAKTKDIVIMFKPVINNFIGYIIHFFNLEWIEFFSQGWHQVSISKQGSTIGMMEFQVKIAFFHLQKVIIISGQEQKKRIRSIPQHIIAMQYAVFNDYDAF